MMFNFYPWGLSLNIVYPEGPERTRISFQTYLLPDANLKNFRDQVLDVTEMEDEHVVLKVQQGVKSRLYVRGRYSPSMERCVHHFHRLITQAMNDSP